MKDVVLNIIYFNMIGIQAFKIKSYVSTFLWQDVHWMKDETHNLFSNTMYAFGPCFKQVLRKWKKLSNFGSRAVVSIGCLGGGGKGASQLHHRVAWTFRKISISLKTPIGISQKWGILIKIISDKFADLSYLYIRSNKYRSGVSWLNCWNKLDAICFTVIFQSIII